jgi:chemotaxis methyl-accepting protein methylase
MPGHLARIPGGARLLESALFQKLRHKLSQRVNARVNSHFTGFLRLPSQFDALVGPVVAAVSAGRGGAALRIAVLGCSNGAEAYTIASVLRRAHPQLPFAIAGYDIDEGCVLQARQALYARDEIYNNQIITEDFVATTFAQEGDRFRVVPSVAERATFAVGDVLAPDLAAVVGTCDIVFAQNFLFHLPPDLARQALVNIHRLLRRGAAMFIDGVDLDLRYRFVRANRLAPLDCKIREIHEEARRARAVGWPYEYWGLEPFMTYRRDWQRRYATIFMAE